MFDLSRYLPYLLNRAGARIGLAFSEEVRQFGITLPMWRVLAQLWHEEFRRQSDIADLTSLDRTTLSRLLKTIETKGLITRTRLRENARLVKVAMTPKGRALTRRIIPLARRYETLAVGAIPPDRIRALKDMLTEIYGNISAYHRGLSRRTKKRKTPSSVRASPARRSSAGRVLPGWSRSTQRNAPVSGARKLRRNAR